MTHPFPSIHYPIYFRLKDVAQEQYTQAEAERGAGMTKEKYPPAHPALRQPAAAEESSSSRAVGDADEEVPDL